MRGSEVRIASMWGCHTSDLKVNATGSYFVASERSFVGAGSTPDSAR